LGQLHLKEKISSYKQYLYDILDNNSTDIDIQPLIPKINYTDLTTWIIPKFENLLEKKQVRFVPFNIKAYYVLPDNK
jgi:hypothetical protein